MDISTGRTNNDDNELRNRLADGRLMTSPRTGVWKPRVTTIVNEQDIRIIKFIGA